MDAIITKQYVEKHRSWAFEPSNRSPKTRIETLSTLERALIQHRERLIEALTADLGKPSMEAYASELSVVIHEIRYVKKRVRRWMARRRTGLVNRGMVVREPFGAALVIGPWNYPIQLTLMPLVSALAAGNGVTVKPSELAPVTASAIQSMLNDAFDPEVVRTVLGDAETAKGLLDSGYDKVFFTGSPTVGAQVAERAARHHSDVTLELGGKSPAIVASDSNIEFAARRIAWGKFLNAGQTCIAPDYALIHESIRPEFTEALKRSLRGFFGKDAQKSPDYGRMVNVDHFDRVSSLIQDNQTIFGGRVDKDQLFIEPTIVAATPDSPVMEQEIFGPVLPLLSWKTLEDVKAVVGAHPNPLALYCFSKNRRFLDRVVAEIPFGGGALNDTILQVASSKLPFGGRGSSGRGNYHGVWGFQAFSHFKGIKVSRQGHASSMRFPPYRPMPERIRRMVFGI